MIDKDYKPYINGAWVDVADKARFDIVQPYDRSLFARVQSSGRAEAQAAVAAAHAAFPAWKALPPAEKAGLFRKAARIIERRTPEIIGILARETGSTALLAGLQQQFVVNTLEAATGMVYQPRGEVYPSDTPGLYSTGVRRPLGVVASFTPWNAASLLSWRATVLPLAAGNTVVLKPSELAPISAGLVIAEVVEEAGFPAGVVNVLPHAPGTAAEIADVFFEGDLVRCINLIGGVKTARILAERAGKTLKRTVMELGGYNVLIVLDDVDVDRAIDAAVLGSFLHQGQICSNTRKIVVQRGIYDEFLTKFVARVKGLPSGDPLNPQTIVGPLITPGAVELVHAAVQEALAGGAKLQLGGTFEGQIYAPTILSDVPDDAAAAKTETFGPLVVVQPVDTVEEAVDLANRGNYGLTAGILSGDTYRGLSLAPDLMAGNVHVNGATVPMDEAHVPMGGVRDSGWGRSGPESIHDFTDLIWITARSEIPTLPF